MSHFFKRARPNRRCLLVAILAMALVWAWMATTVQFNYRGNWTGLFCTGAALPPPAALAHENIFIFPNSVGYDGQAYHYLAHDPFLIKGFAASMDMPRVRSRRPLLSWLAWSISLGRDSWIDASLIAVVLGFIGLGVYWLARLALTYGFSVWSGLLFAVAPPVVVSIDRILTDGALAAFCVAFVLYWREKNYTALWLVCLLAALTRETGAALAGAMCLYFLFRRFVPALPGADEVAGASSGRRNDLTMCAVFGMSVVPFVAWAWYCTFHTAKEGLDWLGPIPFGGLVHRLLTPLAYKLPRWIELVCIALDYIGLLGILIAFWEVWKKARARTFTPAGIAIYLYALLTVFLKSYDAWAEVYAFGRTLAPMLILLALDGFERKSIRPVMPAFFMLPRIVVQFGGQLTRVAQGLTGA